MSKPTSAPISGSAVLLTMVGIYVSTLGTVVALEVFGNGGDTVTLIVAQLAPTIASVAAFMRIEQTRKEVNTALNGQMDEKIQTNVGEVLERHGVPQVPNQRQG